MKQVMALCGLCFVLTLLESAAGYKVDRQRRQGMSSRWALLALLAHL